MSRLTRGGTAEPVSRDQILRHERGQGNINFSCSPDHAQDWQPYLVDPYSCHMCDYTTISTFSLIRNTSANFLHLQYRKLVYIAYLSEVGTWGSKWYGCVCMVTTYSRVWINRVRLPILLVISSTEKINISLSPFAPDNLVSRDGFGSPVPRPPAHSPYSGLIWCAYSRDSSQFPRRCSFSHLNRHTPSGQSRVYRVTQLRADGVHCRESAGTGPVVLRVVPVTGAATMDQLMCASLFPHSLVVWRGHVESTISETNGRTRIGYNTVCFKC